MPGCECCNTSVPSNDYPKTTELPNGNTVEVCLHCRSAIRSGDYSTVPNEKLD